MLSNCIYDIPLCLLATGKVASFIRAWAQISLSYPPSLSLFGWGGFVLEMEGFVLEMEYDENLLQYLHCLH